MKHCDVLLVKSVKSAYQTNSNFFAILSFLGPGLRARQVHSPSFCL